MLRDFFSREDMPNKLSIAMGELIRQAREEKGWSQSELANAVYKRRPSISEIEQGKMYPDIVTLLLMASHLNKPLSYFLPVFSRPQQIREDNLTPQEEELLIHFRRINRDNQKQLAINQIKAIADFEESN